MLYYQVGDKICRTNVEALKEFTKNPAAGLEAKFRYKFTNNPEIWLKEPELSVYEYMDRHAEILSQNYKKIHLRYSGGTDSHTMLESFKRISAAVTIEHTLTDEMSNFSKQMFDHSQLDFKTVSQWDNVKDFQVFQLRGLTHREFTNLLDNYQGHLASQTSNTSVIWDLQSAKTSFKAQDNAVKVSGKEKPMLSVKDGWWHWTALDAKFGDSQLDLDRGTHVWFFLSDDVPELQIKLAYNKIKIIESIAQQENSKITQAWVDDVQKTSSKYYQTINHGMGYKGLNDFLDSNRGKLGATSGIRRREYKQWNNKNHISHLYNEYAYEVIGSIREDLYNVTDCRNSAELINLGGDLNIAGVYHQPIPMKPISKDLL
jgi:hypothetical protein